VSLKDLHAVATVPVSGALIEAFVEKKMKGDVSDLGLQVR